MESWNATADVMRPDCFGHLVGSFSTPNGLGYLRTTWIKYLDPLGGMVLVSLPDQSSWLGLKAVRWWRYVAIPASDSVHKRSCKSMTDTCTPYFYEFTAPGSTFGENFLIRTVFEKGASQLFSGLRIIIIRRKTITSSNPKETWMSKASISLSSNVLLAKYSNTSFF